MEPPVITVTGQNTPQGETIRFENGKPVTPVNPIIPFIEGDGIGPEIRAATQRIVDAAVKETYRGKRKIHWREIYAAEKAMKLVGTPLPEATLAAIREYGVAIKGPLGTPTGGGMRSLNVAMRKYFDLYQCVRPVRWYPGVPSPVVRPQDLERRHFPREHRGHLRRHRDGRRIA